MQPFLGSSKCWFQNQIIQRRFEEQPTTNVKELKGQGLRLSNKPNKRQEMEGTGQSRGGPVHILLDAVMATSNDLKVGFAVSRPCNISYRSLRLYMGHDHVGPVQMYDS
jgi:hypothetical protein